MWLKGSAQRWYISVGDVTVRWPRQFGFCYGVERRHRSRLCRPQSFQDRRLFIVGEIIHNRK